MATKSLTVLRYLVVAACAAPALAQQTTAPPGGATFDAAEHLNISPKNGQTQEQVWSDRYACHNWAKTQSGFDPTKPASAASPSDAASQREQYRHAVRACLESRGYGVSEATASSAAAPGAAGSAAVGSAPAANAPLRNAEASRRRYSPAFAEFKYHPLTVAIDGGYTIAQGNARRALDDGYNTGLSINWFPSSRLPLGLHINGSYLRFTENDQSVDAVSQATGLNHLFGHQDLYGGDVDLQLNLRMGPSIREYFFGGVGWYRQHTAFKQLSFERGIVCDFDCFRAIFPVATTVQENTTGWMHSWNAGMGFEFALTDPASFFVEARYMRLSPAGGRMEFVPITIGLRF